MTTQHLRMERVDISFTMAGTGPAVLLLHGWPQTSYAWRSIIRRTGVIARQALDRSAALGRGQAQRPHT